MGRKNRRAILWAAGLSVAVIQAAWGASSTWNGTTDANWTTATNWSGNLVAGTSNTTTSTDTATFNNSGAGHAYVTVDLARNVQNIVFNGSNVGAYHFSYGGLRVTAGGQFLIGPSVNTIESFNSPITIGGTNSAFYLTNNATNYFGNYFLTSNISPVVPTATQYNGTTYLVLGGSNGGNNYMNGTIAGATGSGVAEDIGVIKTGAGSWELGGTESYSGTTQVNAGTLIISGRFQAQPIFSNATLDLTGACSAQLITYGLSSTLLGGNGHFTSPQAGIDGAGTITIDNTGTLMSNRLAGAPLGLASGSLIYNSGSGDNTEQVGTLTTTEGGNSIILQPNSGGSTVFQCSSLYGSGTSGYPGTLLVTGQNLGSSPGANVTNFIANSLGTHALPIGGGGYAGTPTISIQNFIVGRDTALNGNDQYGFVTDMTSSNGLRLLDKTTEYAPSISESVDFGTAYRNVSLTAGASVVLPGTTVNLLRLDSGASVGGTGTLTVYSGAILALAGNNGISVANLNFGSAEGIITTIGDMTLGGRVTGSGGLVKTGPGNLSLAPSVNLAFTGAMTVGQGTVVLNANNQLPPATQLYLSGGALNLNGYNQSSSLIGGLFAGGNSSVFNPSNRPYATVTVNYGLNTFLGTIGGLGGNNLGLTIDAGKHSLSLANANTYTGPTNLSSGALVLDFSSQNSAITNILPGSTHLNDGGQVVFYLGALQSTQSFAGVTFNPGSSELLPFYFSTSGGSLTVNLGTLTRTTGATVMARQTAGQGGFTTTSPNTNGILGGYFVLNDTDWATSNGTTGFLTVPTYVNDVWSAGANVNITASATVTSTTANSIRFGAAASSTLTLVGTNIINSGGILVSSAVAGSATKITGGSLTAGAGHDLIINQWSTGVLRVDSVIADNGAATPLTVSGPGTTLLTAANTYTGGTYLNGGQLSISSNANLGLPSVAAPLHLATGTLYTTATNLSLDDGAGNKRPVTITGAGATCDIPYGDTLTFSGIVSGTAASQLTVVDYGTLALTGVNTYPGTFYMQRGVLTLSNPLAAQFATVDIYYSASGNSLTFGPGVTVATVGELTDGGSSAYINLVSVSGGVASPVNLTVGNDNGAGAFAGMLIGSGSLTKTGIGSFTLQTANSYRGATTINGGRLIAAVSGALPIVGLNSGSVVNNATLEFAATTTSPAISGSGTTVIDTGVTVKTPAINQSLLLVSGALQTTGTVSNTIGQILGSGSIMIGGSSSGQANSLRLSNGGGRSVISSLTINAGSQLDIASNSLDICYGQATDPIGTILGYLQSGISSANHSGSGIVTSAGDAIHTLGCIDSPGIDLLIGYTYYGDANLDGQVDGSDYSLIDNGYLIQGADWVNGDFNYDGVVDGSDYTLIDNAFNSQGNPLNIPVANPSVTVTSQIDGTVLVPEPATLGWLSIASIALVGRRRRVPVNWPDGRRFSSTAWHTTSA